MQSHHLPGEEGKDKGYCNLGCLRLNNTVLALMFWKLLPGAISLRVLNMKNQELFGYLEDYAARGTKCLRKILKIKQLDEQYFNWLVFRINYAQFQAMKDQHAIKNISHLFLHLKFW